MKGRIRGEGEEEERVESKGGKKGTCGEKDAKEIGRGRIVRREGERKERR